MPASHLAGRARLGLTHPTPSTLLPTSSPAGRVHAFTLLPTSSPAGRVCHGCSLPPDPPHMAHPSHCTCPLLRGISLAGSRPPHVPPPPCIRLPTPCRPEPKKATFALRLRLFGRGPPAREASSSGSSECGGGGGGGGCEASVSMTGAPPLPPTPGNLRLPKFVKSTLQAAGVWGPGPELAGSVAVGIGWIL